MVDAYGKDVYSTLGPQLSQKEELEAKIAAIKLIEDRINQVGIAAVLYDIIERIKSR